MAEVFTRNNYVLNGVFSADTTRVSLGRDVSPFLIQNLNVNYAQNVTRLYEVGANGPAVGGGRNACYVYYVGGRAQGTAGLGRIIGPRVQLARFYNAYGDVCQAGNNNLSFDLGQSDCRPNALALSARVKYTCKYCVLVQVGFSVTAQDMVIGENGQMMFSSMDYVGP